MTAATQTRLHRAVLAASFGLSAVLALLLAVDSALHGLLAVGLGAVAFGAGAVLRRLVAAGRSVDWLLAVAALNAVLVAPELGLQLADFRYESGIQFGYPRPSRMLGFEPDAQLFWRLRSSDPDVNSLGFLGPEVVTPKPEGTFRMLFLGDSCTYQRYPLMVESLMTQRLASEIELEVVNLGVPGYSSHQGRVLAETHAARFEPDRVFVYFGWNDHWLAYGATDAEKVVTPPPGWTTRWPVSNLQRTRSAQFARKLWHAIRARKREEPLAELRVPADVYRQNLHAIHRSFARRGVPVVFLTAPSSHASRGVPGYLVEERFATDKSSVLRLHATYNELTRQVARETGAVLIDLAHTFDRADQPDEHFMADGIHLQYAGLELIAQEITRHSPLPGSQSR